MNIVEHLPNIYLTEHPAEVFEVRGAVVVGEKAVAVWDTLLLPENMAGIAELSQGKPIHVVYSHADWDHIWGTAGLRYEDVIAHKLCKKRFEDPDDVEKFLNDKIAKDPTYEVVKLIPPTRSFATGLNLDLGGLTLELQHLAGHTLDCIVAFVPERAVLIAGDTVETPLPIVYEDSPLGDWISKLEAWQQDPRLEHVIPSHGVVGGKEILERNIVYLQALREGRTPDVPQVMEEFYIQEHQNNMKRAVQNS